MPRRASFRYLGDQEALVVHDLDHEDENNCQVQPLLRAGRGITFRPDRLSEPLRRAFSPCPHCVDEQPDEAGAGTQTPDTLRAGVFGDRAHPQTP